jgi:hypothetical protein
LEGYDKCFWVNVNKDYCTFVWTKMLPMRRYLTDYFRLEDHEFLNWADEIENELYNSLKKEFIKKSRDLPDKAVELFRKDFWYEGGNVQRNWNKMKDEDIDSLFKTCRAQYLDLFEDLKLYKLIKSPLKRKKCLISSFEL